jgi:hypothetical protein
LEGADTATNDGIYADSIIQAFMLAAEARKKYSRKRLDSQEIWMIPVV